MWVETQSQYTNTIEGGIGSRGSQTGVAMFRYSRNVFSAVSLGSELFRGWDKLIDSGSMSISNSHFQEATSSVTISALLANATVSYPSAFSGVYATAQGGIASVAMTSIVTVTNMNVVPWFAESKNTNSWHLISGLSAGARYTLPFGIGFGIEGSLKGLASQPPQPFYSASEPNNTQPGRFSYTGPTSDAIMQRIGVSYQFILGYSF